MEASALPAPAGLARARLSIGAPLLRLRSDEQLVSQFRAGNDEAFRVIYERYRQRLFAYTRQMLPGSRQDAEDTLQDVFVRAYSGLRANDEPWLCGRGSTAIAHNRCIDELRRPPRRLPELTRARPPADCRPDRRGRAARVAAPAGRRRAAAARSAALGAADARARRDDATPSIADALGVSVPRSSRCWCGPGSGWPRPRRHATRRARRSARS